MGNIFPTPAAQAKTEFWWTVGMINLSIVSVIGSDYLISNGASLFSNVFSSSTRKLFSYEALRAITGYGHIAVGCAVIVASLYIKSPYGRHAPNAEGQKLPAVISWIIQESPTLISFFYFNIKFDLAPIILNPALVLFLIHYINRTIVFPLLLGKGTPQRVWVTFSALSYCVFNGLLQNGLDSAEAARAGKFTLENIYKNHVDCPALALAGVGLFALGMSCNIIVDRYLIAMKEKHKTYVIPRHILFSKISCPNFFFETVEWFGFAVATAGCTGLTSSFTIAAASFCFFTASNTWMRALQHHQFYLEKFGAEYKKLNRKAVVPYIL